ncbi:hypothetical protein ACM0CQ_15815 [Mycobacteroides abscessus subsp. abscessus]|uniref:hypothetical protein n=1 Tax=Mycobacteroides abscessus TaxID=36809 RepID=UPI0039F13915
MNVKRLALTATAAMAAVAVSACTGTVSGEATSASNVPSSSSTAVVAQPVWAPLPAAPVPSDEADVRGFRYGKVSTGYGVFEVGDSTRLEAGCTLGPVVAPTMDHTARGWVIAGHCDRAELTRVAAFSDPVHTSRVDVGVYTPQSGVRRVDATTLYPSRSASADNAPRVAGYPVAGVLTNAATEQLPEGTPVCVAAAKSGLQCGTYIDTIRGGIILDRLRTVPGDSGSPLFTYDANSDSVTLIGILTRSAEDAANSYGAVLDTALEDNGALAVVDAASAVDPAANPAYSSRVVRG